MPSTLSILGCALGLCACASSSPEVRGSSGDSPGRGTEAAGFTVDAKWPRQLPNNWILGQVSGIAVDADDHVWLLQRPGSLTEDEKGAALKPPQSKCCLPAPPVLEFDADGKLLRAWGGPGNGYDWPGNQHRIHVDAKGLVWISRHRAKDGLVYVCDRLNDRVQVFKRDGTFVKEFSIEPRTPANGSVWDLALSRDPGQRFLYLADGRNNQLLTLARDTGAVVATTGYPGRSAGAFHWVHDIALDSQGNLYAGEVDTGKRAQRFAPAAKPAAISRKP